MSFELFSQHGIGCQVVHHRAPKLQESETHSMGHVYQKQV